MNYESFLKNLDAKFLSFLSDSYMGLKNPNLSGKKQQVIELEKKLVEITKRFVGAKFIKISEGRVIESTLTQVELYADCIGDTAGDCYKAINNQHNTSKAYDKIITRPMLV